MKKEKIFVTAYDVALIENVCLRTARKVIGEVKKQCNKTKKQLVTIPEYSRFSGLDENDVRRILNG